MGNDTQGNEEQLEMLLMTLGEVRHGICLFQSENQRKRVSLIQERFGKEKVIVHDIAEDDEEKGMVSSKDFRRWASETDAKVVIVYNLQLLGLRFGDEEVIEKLNFMRDQILAIGKLFVFGVSSYFNRLLSRNARDLYSCILHHFIFQDSEEKLVGITDLDIGELSGDDALETSRYMELKERIQSHSGARDLSMYLACMESWNGVRKYLSYQEMDFIKSLAEEVDRQYAQKNIEIVDVEDIWILAHTWIKLENMERSAFWYQKMLCFVGEKLGEEHELYADALVNYSNFYGAVSDYATCEKFCDQAIKIYSDKNKKYSSEGRNVLQLRARLYNRQSKFDAALKIYEDLLEYQIDKYGVKYYENASLYCDIGCMYYEQGDFSHALLKFNEALNLYEGAGKKGGWIAEIYINLSSIYLQNEDANTAWKYIKKAKKIVTNVYGNESSILINIYNNMSEIWSACGRTDRGIQYLQKALLIINKKHLENSESAAIIYYNLARVFYLTANVKDVIYYCRYVIKIMKKTYGGENNKLTACAYEQMAYALYKTSDHLEAKKAIDKARSIYASIYGSQNECIKRIDEFLNTLK